MQTKIIQWKENKEDPLLTEEIFQKLHADVQSTGKTRYRFTAASKQDQVIKMIFESAMKKNQSGILKATENSSYFFGSWRKVVWIDTPRTLSEFLANRLVKVIASIVLTVCFVSNGYLVYRTIQNVLIPRSIPFIINNTPTQVIRAANVAFSCIEKIYRNPIQFLLGLYVLKTIVLMGPNIPYITRLARAISMQMFIDILIFPETIGIFLFRHSLGICFFGWNKCDEASQILGHFAKESENKRVASYKPQAYTLWVNAMKTNL